MDFGQESPLCILVNRPNLREVQIKKEKKEGKKTKIYQSNRKGHNGVASAGTGIQGSRCRASVLDSGLVERIELLCRAHRELLCDVYLVEYKATIRQEEIQNRT